MSSIDLSDVAAIIAIVVSVFSILLAYVYRKNLSFSEQSVHIPTMFKELFYRKVKIDEKSMSIEEIIKKINTLSSEEINRDAEKYKRFVQEATLGLQRIGFLVLSGIVPIELVLPDWSRLIVECWMSCDKIHKGEEFCTKDTNLTFKSNAKIFWYRRHAKWLFYASALYLLNYWQGDLTTKKLPEFIKNREKESIKTLEKRYREAEIKHLTGNRRMNNRIEMFVQNKRGMSDKIRYALFHI